MKKGIAAFGSGTVIGTLGGLIGLGGAEFRLPVLIGGFRFHPLDAVILNKAISLVVIATALPFRARVVPFPLLAQHWEVIANLLLGSMTGAWIGAGWAIHLKLPTLSRVIACLLVVVALVLIFGHSSPGLGRPLFEGSSLWIAGVLTGLGIGIFASLLGVAGGELLIPAIIILYGLDIKLAGSLSLAVSLPTMLTAFTRYSRDKSFVILKQNSNFVIVMALGSIIGTFIGAHLLGVVPSQILLPTLAGMLFISAYKIQGYQKKDPEGTQ